MYLTYWRQHLNYRDQALTGRESLPVFSAALAIPDRPAFIFRRNVWGFIGASDFLAVVQDVATWAWSNFECFHAQPEALGALIVAAAYLLLAIVASSVGTDRANWLWLVLFFVVFSAGELYILPTGLGLFARLTPIGFGATAMAAWFWLASIISSAALPHLTGYRLRSLPHSDCYRQ